jgi:hypothetical protein|tara:strand:+ start:652 stop:849 length:198 start_codon:yes stop_codon:yes gene_type:complete
MDTLITLLIVIPFIFFGYLFIFRGGEKIAETKLKFIKNEKWRGFVGIMILVGIINAVLYILFEIF